MFVPVVHPLVGFDFHYVLQCDSKLRPPPPITLAWRHCGGMCQIGVTSDVPEGNKLKETITWQRGQRGCLRGDEDQALGPEEPVKVLA